MTSWEQKAVDEQEILELRHQTIMALLVRKNETWLIAEALRLNTSRLEQQIDELFSELSDIEVEMGND